MKDFFSNVTFGFLMAQLVPGTIAFLGFGLLHTAILFAITGVPPSMTVVGAIEKLIDNWTLTTARQVGFLAVCKGFGMLIHGLHWSVLGFLEHKGDRVAHSFWHSLPVAFQILLGPVKTVSEITWFLVSGRSILDLAMEENAPKIPKDQMEAFKFLQEFYLHFAQFYAHSGYALVIVFCGLLSYLFAAGSTLHNVVGTVLAYLLAGLCFVVGRIQLASMFSGERELVALAPKSVPTAEHLGRIALRRRSRMVSIRGRSGPKGLSKDPR